MEPGTKTCPYCAETIKDAAIKCRYCGEFLSEDSRPCIADVQRGVVENRSNPGLAAVFSTVVPGLGQIYQGRILEGLLFMVILGFFTILAAFSWWGFFLVSAALYVANIYDAYHAFLRSSEAADRAETAGERPRPIEPLHAKVEA